jgi:capsular polysaccharide transport system ATP-binding protein
MTLSMLSFQSVKKSFRTQAGRKVILHEFTGRIPKGKRIGVLGMNGAGKSTLLRLISGSEKPDGGRIERQGRVSFPVGFTGTFHPHLSASENVRFLAELYGMDAEETVGWVEDFCELGQYFRMPINTYSSGMYARLAFGASFAIDFDYFLVDEVIETGDARFRSKCAAAFEARLADATLVLVSQNMNTIRTYCESGAVLHDGSLTIHDTMDEALDEYEDILARAVQ